VRQRLVDRNHRDPQRLEQRVDFMRRHVGMNEVAEHLGVEDDVAHSLLSSRW
jgi:hypothetical protein